MTRSAPKPPTISRTVLMRSSGVLSSIDIDGRLRAEFSRERQPRRLRRADTDHPARTHFLCGRDRQNADRTGALNHDRIAPGKSARAGGAVEGANAGGQRLRQRAEPQRHVVGQLVDLGARQFLEIDIDIFGPAAPQMRRLVKAEIAAVIDRRQALVGALGIMDAVIALAARHQRRDHDLGSHRERLAHEVFLEFRADLDQHAADLVTERKRPRQRLRPVPFEDMQIGAADAAGANLDQRALLRDFRPRHGADDRLRTRSVIGAYANLFHEISCPCSCFCSLRSVQARRKP